MFKVIFYRKCNGESPVEKFLLSLDIKMRAKVLRAINLLADFGNKLREPDSKLLEDGIFELRVKLGSDIVRVLYFFCEGRIVVLTNGFVKKTQKTPENEIRMAKKYRSEYLKRSKTNE